jgi:DNA/RNA endonuclease G (NUC1)
MHRLARSNLARALRLQPIVELIAAADGRPVDRHQEIEMRVGSLKRAFFVAASALLLAANGIDGRIFGTETVAAKAPAPAVRISEFHYDNVSTDTGEAIEVSGPAGTSLNGWSIVLYNGVSTSRASYDTKTLSGTIPATCDTRGVVVQTYPSNGIQNGDPDGIALVDASGAVVEFLSYEGSFTAANGPAVGMTSVDIGAREAGTEIIGLSLQRTSTDTWTGPVTSTFGVCNDADQQPPTEVATVTVSPASATIVEGGTRTFTAAAFDANENPIPGVEFAWSTSDSSIVTVNAQGIATAVTAGDATISATAGEISGSATVHVEAAPPPTGPADAQFTEIHYDNDGTDAGEAIEIEARAGTDLTGWSVALYNATGGVVYDTRPFSGVVSESCDGRGVAVLFYPPNGIQNGPADAFALVNDLGQVVEFLSYEGTLTATNGPAVGLTSTDIGASEATSTPIGLSLQRYTNDQWTLAAQTFGACNGATPPPLPKTITITGRNLSDPPLPVGFQDQLFASMEDALGNAIPTTFTWSTETPDIASIDPLGVITSLGEGTATIRVTAADGTTRTISLPTRVAVASATALYVGNAAFGEPTDNDPSDDFIVRYPQFTASFNSTRGTPNWVAFEMDPTHFGAEDRCDCFTFDPALPSAFPRYTTADYTGAGAIAGFGIDRGHLARSFDRTAASLDNARTFLFTNIVPQAADLNQGPWSDLEFYLGDLVRTGGKEVYVIAGVAGNKGTVKNEGKIVIPESTWKVAVIMPHDEGLANVVDYRDLEVIAVNMPNEPGIRNVNWETYKTTVDAIEGLTGYDLLALLDDKTENIVEAGIMPPFAVTDGPYSSVEGSAVAMTATASFDPNGSVVNYQWLFGDGSSASGPAVSHTYAQDGTYTVTLVVTDNDGLTDTITTSTTVGNVAPVIAPVAGVTGLLPGETYSAAGSFVDPGADTWSATVDYGDGSGAGPLALAGQTFALSHTYNTAGTFTVTISINDGTTASTTTTTVAVMTPTDAIKQAVAAVDALVAAGTLSTAQASSLKAKLTGAAKNIAEGDVNGALDKLQSTISALDALMRAGRLPVASGTPIRALIERTIQSLSR